MKPSKEDSVEKAFKALVNLARRNSAVFAELILRDTSAGQKPIKLNANQKEWHKQAMANKNMVIWAHPESGKTQNLAIAYIIWKLGVRPESTHAIISDTKDQAKKTINAIKQHIDDNPWVHKVFPHLRKGDVWSKTEIKVEREFGISDPSVNSFGLSTGIVGSRLDTIILDDILSEANTATEYQRDKTEKFIASSALSRLLGPRHLDDGTIVPGGQVIFLTNAWHPDDLAHRYAERDGWWAKKYPILDSAGRSTWAERWPVARIDKQRGIYTPLQFERVMMCNPTDNSTARFRGEWIDDCKKKGKGSRMFTSLLDMKNEFEWAEKAHQTRIMPAGYSIVTGVDLAIGKKKKHDKSVLFTIMNLPNGDRRVLNIDSGRWSASEIITKIVENRIGFNSTIVVENNAGQDYIRQLAIEDPRLTVNDMHHILPHTTGMNKYSPEYGVETIASELYQRRWIIPCNDQEFAEDEVNVWLSEMLTYIPGQHTGDRLMACWFAQHFSRSIEEIPSRKVVYNVRVIG